MKTINKVLETMLSKPATPTWTATDIHPHASAQVPSHFGGPTQMWSWGG